VPFGLPARLRAAASRLARRLGAPPALPPVSVIIPSYNHERYLGAALESALGQSHAPAEILVLDDGSQDGTFAVAQAAARRSARVQAFRQENRGAHHTLNQLVHRCRGPLVAILNSDDLFHPLRLERCAASLAARPEVAAVSTGLFTIDGEGRPRADPWLDDALAFRRRTPDLGAALCYANFVCTTSNLVARKEALLRLGGFDGLRYVHDLELLLQLLSSGAGLHLLDGALLAYRVHAKNTVKESEAAVRREWAAVIAAHARAAGSSAALEEAIRLRGLGEGVEQAARKLSLLQQGERASAAL
jgi:glycosyltransferase involved in cell wall biosynthesis